MTFEKILIAAEPELGEYVKYEPLADEQINIDNIRKEFANIYTAIGISISLGRSYTHYNERLIKLKEMMVHIA